MTRNDPDIDTQEFHAMKVSGEMSIVHKGTNSVPDTAFERLRETVDIDEYGEGDLVAVVEFERFDDRPSKTWGINVSRPE